MDDFFEAILNGLYFLIIFCIIMMIIISLAYVIITKEMFEIPVIISAVLTYFIVKRSD
jgi:hypothetical protein